MLIKLLLLAFVLLLVVGARRIAGVGKGLSDGIKNLKDGLRDEDSESRDEAKSESAAKPSDRG